MFFEQNDLRLNILSVLYLRWEESSEYAVARPYNALSYRIRGNADFTHDGQTVHVGKGEILYVPKDFDYTINAHDEELIVIHFDLENETENKMSVISPTNTGYFEKRYRSLYLSWTKKQIGYQYECKSEIYKILALLYKQKSEQKLDFTNDKMNEIIEYIHDHFTEQKLGVSALADMANMSDTYFRKLFVSAFYKTPLKYINDLRVSYALELLRSGYYSVNEASEKSGFDNQKYFSTVIKKITGRAPLSYKKETNQK